MSGTTSLPVGDGREYVLRPDDQKSDTEGHFRFFIDLQDEDRFLDALRKRRGEPGSTRIQMAPADEADTQGHGAGFATTVIVRPEGDDTEGHAISLHFPTAEEADAFRRRLLVTGLVVGTVTIGALGATALPGFQAGSGTGQGIATQRTTTADSDVGMMDSAGTAAAQAMAAQMAAANRANRDVGIMDSSSAAAAETMAGQAAVDRENSDIGIMDASGRPTTDKALKSGYVPPERPRPTRR
jgi:hypothetical protein